MCEFYKAEQDVSMLVETHSSFLHVSQQAALCFEMESDLRLQQEILLQPVAGYNSGKTWPFWEGPHLDCIALKLSVKW